MGMEAGHTPGMTKADELLALAWQPIETAPKDGTPILIAGGTYADDWPPGANPFSGVTIASFDRMETADEFAWQGEKQAHDVYRYHAPTHWMPLPPPPQGQ
jgi:hypothetical protein